MSLLVSTTQVLNNRLATSRHSSSPMDWKSRFFNWRGTRNDAGTFETQELKRNIAALSLRSASRL